MGFASDTGYVPLTIAQIMDAFREGVNAQFGTTYTVETFIGTNFYKYFYAAAQRVQSNEIKTSEIFQRMQEYFRVTNEKVLRPNTTHPGIYDYFKSKGYLVSTKPPADIDAGKAYICVDVKDNHARGSAVITSFANLVSGTDDAITVGATVFTAQTGAATLGTGTFQASSSNAETAVSLATQINAHATAGAIVEAWAVDGTVFMRTITPGTGGNSTVLTYTNNDGNVGATVSGATFAGGYELEDGDEDYDDVKLELCNLVKDCVVGGVVSQGTEIETIVLDNGQSFDFKYLLPERIPVELRLTIVQSENNLFTIEDPLIVAQKLYDNIVASYRLGKNFEPQRYFSVSEAPWASEILLEWSDDAGATWEDDVFDSDFDQLFTFTIDDISIVEV